MIPQPSVPPSKPATGMTAAGPAIKPPTGAPKPIVMQTPISQRISLTPRVDAAKPMGAPVPLGQRPTAPAIKPFGGAGAPTTPPRPAGVVDAAGVRPPEKGKTSRIPLESAKPSEAGSPAFPPGAKSRTSRIPLEALGAEAAALTAKPGAPKTIKIRPAAVPIPAARMTAAIPMPISTGAGAPGSTPEKSKTSRISLESAIQTPEAEAAREAAAKEAPQTVKIRAPGQAPAEARAVEPADAKESLSKTARLDEAVPEPEAEAGGARKTIKVKRPGGLKLAPATRMPGTSILPPQAAVVEAPAKAGISDLIFSLVGIAAVVVACVLIYVLAAQINPASGMSWPGKIAAVQ
jgi:hypothetical protein